VKHIDLDSSGEQVKQFVLSLELDAEGSLLEVQGKPVARVFPVHGEATAYDRDKLKAAILARRDESRRLNDEWKHADEDVWDNISSSSDE
jgi:hypothetical protein